MSSVHRSHYHFMQNAEAHETLLRCRSNASTATPALHHNAGRVQRSHRSSQAYRIDWLSSSYASLQMCSAMSPPLIKSYIRKENSKSSRFVYTDESLLYVHVQGTSSDHHTDPTWGYHSETPHDDPIRRHHQEIRTSYFHNGAS